MWKSLSHSSSGVIVGVSFLLLCLSVTQSATGSTQSADDDKASEDIEGKHGLGTHIDWQSLTDGFLRSKTEKKPLMLVIHKSWCGACKALKPKFRESKELAVLSRQFVMVNTLDDEEPKDDLYQPDGGYIPRILFFDSDGDLQKDIINENGNPQYKYYYYDDTAIISSMKRALSVESSSDSQIPAEDASFGEEDDNDDTATGSDVRNEL